MRRDAYATHVKAKHMKDIARLLLEEFGECKVNTISAYASEQRVSALPIYSKMYQDAAYWFGVKPLFYIRESIEVPYDETRPDTKLKPYPEDLEQTQYLKREENMIAHRKFIEEVLQSISLMDFIQIGKDMTIRNPDVVVMKTELITLRAAHKELEESSKNQIERLKKDVEMWKETAEEKEFIADLKRNLSYYKAYSARLKDELEYTKKLYQEKDQEHDENMRSINQSRCSELSYSYEQNDRLKKENTELKEKMEVKVQKLFEKKLKEEKKEKEKAKKILKEAKKKKKLAEMSDTDSDSGSDSD
jgi:hypothetical protein